MDREFLRQFACFEGLSISATMRVQRAVAASGHTLPIRQRSRSITQGFFPLQGTGQRFLLNRDRLRTRVLQLMGLGRVELDIFREFWRKIHVRVDGVHGAYFYTGHAINAVLRVNDHLVLHFVETGDRADLYTVGELASVAFLSHDVGHGI
jgi:hypothetical protein